MTRFGKIEIEKLHVPFNNYSSSQFSRIRSTSSNFQNEGSLDPRKLFEAVLHVCLSPARCLEDRICLATFDAYASPFKSWGWGDKDEKRLVQRIIGGKSWVERDSWERRGKIVLTREHATSFDRA